MKIRFIMLLHIASLGMHSFGSDFEARAATYNKQLDSSDLSVRTKAIENLTRDVKKSLMPWQHPEESTFPAIATTLLPVIARGIDDKNEGVKLASLHAVAVIATARGASKGFARDGDAYIPVKRGIISALSDGDPGVRSGAYILYAKCFGASPQIQQSWIRSFSAEPDVNVKKCILKALLIGDLCTPDTLAFVVSQLKDPIYTYDIGMSLLAEIKPPPPEALDIMVKQYADSKEPSERGFLAQVMEQYGNQARRYLPVMQGMLVKETDPIAKENLRHAINSITAGTSGTQSTPSE